MYSPFRGSSSETSWGEWVAGKSLLNVEIVSAWQTPLYPSEPIPTAPPGRPSKTREGLSSRTSADSPSGSHKDMFAFMGSLDYQGTSYKYEVALAGPALELHNCMAKLLAHPLQRPCQSHASYSLLEEDDEATEVEATV